MVLADPLRLKQVLLNLVGNAVKFTDRGEVRVRILPHPDQGHVEIAIEDTGVGVPLEKQALLFEKFVQADGSTTRKRGGTGLGLAISKALVEQMGGFIGLQSAGEGRGTEVRFTIPLAAPEPCPSEAAPAAAEGPGDGPLVLVVEDDPALRNYLQELLRTHGHRALAAGTADEGFAQARRSQPKVVLLDLGLPARAGALLRTGWDLWSALAEGDGDSQPAVILLTGHAEEARRRLDGVPGRQPVALFGKPVNGPELVRTVCVATAEAPGHPLRILVADDDASMREFLRRLLPGSRFRLTMVTTGEEALERLGAGAGAFDLLLLDLVLPAQSGYEVLRQFEGAGRPQGPPVLVLTNYPEPRTEAEAKLLRSPTVIGVMPKSAVLREPGMLVKAIESHRASAVA